jgi:hypothetical protein
MCAVLQQRKKKKKVYLFLRTFTFGQSKPKSLRFRIYESTVSKYKTHREIKDHV